MFAATCCPGVTPEGIESDPLQAFVMAAEYLGTFYRVIPLPSYTTEAQSIQTINSEIKSEKQKIKNKK